MSAASKAASRVYISTEDLERALDDPRTIVFDASVERLVRPGEATRYENGRRRFLEEGHIRGARHVDLIAEFSDPNGAFPFTRPSLQQLQTALRWHGVDDLSRIVVYDSLNGVWAARLWWVLTSAGLADVRILNGGLMIWLQEGRAFSRDEPPARRGSASLTLQIRDGAFSDIEDVLPFAVDGERVLICALKQSDYANGQIPGSRSLPFDAIQSEDGAVDLERARSALASLGIDRSEKLILYCGGGVNAAGLGAALQALDYASISVYDGSLCEWRADPNRPLRRTEAR